MLATGSNRLYYDGAYAPYGESYAGTGTTDLSFTGQNQDTVPNLYDFPARGYAYGQGRWIRPDPAGLVAVDPMNPQSLNRYAYVLNSPCDLMDPLGLDQCNFNIAINNPGGANLSIVEAQINSLLGFVASPSGDTVQANFEFSGKADYTLNIKSGSPNGDFGDQATFLGLMVGPPVVNETAIANRYAQDYSGALGYITGTVAVHELTHKITGIGDLLYGGGAGGPVRLNAG